MKITKKEALALAKVLHQHTGSSLAITPQSKHDETVREVAERLDRFIMVDEADVDYVDDESYQKESPAKDRAQPCDFFGDEDEDDEEEDDEGTHVADPGVLHDLKPARTTVGSIEFEHVVDCPVPHVDLLLDGCTAIEYVAGLRRTGKSLEVKSATGVWTSFEVSKFPKGWSAALPASTLVRAGQVRV